MVALGLGMAFVGLWSGLQRLRGRLFESPLLLWAAVLMGPSGFLAVLAGWVTTEVGRQPWTVYGLLRTADSVSPLAAPAVGTSLVVFFFVYLTVFGAGTIYVLRLMSKAPETGIDENIGPTRTAGITPAAAVDPGRSIHPLQDGR